MTEEKFVKTKWGKLCYLEAGEGRQVLVFLHGWMWWPMLVKDLASAVKNKGYKVIAPYLPGHGKSYRLPDKFTFDDLVGSMSELVNQVSPSRPVALMGHSLGGAIFWEVAVKYPSKVSRLILLDAGLQFLWGKATWKRLIGWLYNQYIDWKGYFNSDNPIWLLVGSKNCSDGPQISAPKRLWKMSALTRISEDELPTSLPVLAMWGQQDRMTPLKEYDPILKKVKKLTLLTFPGGHGWFLWRKNEFFQAINDFL